MNEYTTTRRAQYAPYTQSNPELDLALQMLEAEAANFARIFIQDSNVRFNYMKQTRAMSAEIRALHDVGKITASEGARRAVDLRNLILDAGRLKSSSIGRAEAVKTKARGKTLGELLTKYSNDKFKKPFLKLNTQQQHQVYLEIIDAAGRPNPKYNAIATKMSKLGKGFAVLTFGIAVYNITTAEDKTEAALKEGATIGGGIVGGMAAGAATGLVCGPGAPICSGVLVFVGGALGALGVDLAFDWFSK